MAEGKGGDLALGSLLNLTFSSLHVLLGLVSTFVVSRLLGPEGVGAVAFGFLLLDFTSVFDNLATAGFIRDYAQAPDSRKVATAFAAKIVLGAIATGVLLLLSLPISRAFDVPLIVPLGFSLIPILASLGSVAIASREAQREVLLRNIPPTIERFVGVVLYVLLFATLPERGIDGVGPFVAATLLASLGGSLSGLLVLPKFSPREVSLQDARTYLSFGLRTQTSALVEKGIFWVDVLLVDLLLRSHEKTGLYRSAYAVMAYLPFVAQNVTVLLFPALSESLAREGSRGSQSIFRRGLLYSLGLSLPPALLFLFFPGEVVRWVFGESFEGAAGLLRALVPASLLAVFLMPYNARFNAEGRPSVALKISLTIFLVNLLLDLLLIPRLDLAGAVLATTVAFALGALWAYVAGRD